MKKRVLAITYLLCVSMLAGCGESKLKEVNPNREVGVDEQIEYEDSVASEPIEDVADEIAQDEDNKLIASLCVSDVVFAVYDDDTVQQVCTVTDKNRYISSSTCDGENLFFAESGYNYSEGNNFYHFYKCKPGDSPVDILGELSFTGAKLSIQDGKLCAIVTLSAEENYDWAEIIYSNEDGVYQEESRRILDADEVEAQNLYNKYGDFIEEHKVDIVGQDADGIAYFRTTDNENVGLSKYTVYAYDAENGDLKELYQSSEAPGIPRFPTKGIEGFSVVSGNAYFYDTDGKSTAWYKVDLNAPTKGKTKLTGYEETYDHMELGTVTFENENKKCDDCEMLIDQYYVEKYALNADVQNADSINQHLQEFFEERWGYAKNHCPEMSDEDKAYMHESDYPLTNSYTCQISDMQIIGHYMQINFDAYDYLGGAHGYPIREHLVFDQATGNRVSFKDIYTGSEEDFKKVVADYSLEAYKVNDVGFYEDENDQTFWQKIYDGVTLDQGLHYEQDGVVIEFAPYEYGPFASGYIEIKIPYDKLKISME